MATSVVPQRREMDSIVNALLHLIDGPNREEGSRLTRRLVEHLERNEPDEPRPPSGAELLPRVSDS